MTQSNTSKGFENLDVARLSRRAVSIEKDAERRALRVLLAAGLGTVAFVALAGGLWGLLNGTYFVWAAALQDVLFVIQGPWPWPVRTGVGVLLVNSIFWLLATDIKAWSQVGAIYVSVIKGVDQGDPLFGNTGWVEPDAVNAALAQSKKDYRKREWLATLCPWMLIWVCLISPIWPAPALLGATSLALILRILSEWLARLSLPPRIRQRHCPLFRQEAIKEIRSYLAKRQAA